MPATKALAEVTNVYRRSLGTQRDSTAAAVVGQLQGLVDLSQRGPSLDLRLAEFNTRAAELVSAGVNRAADLSDLYVDTYLVAASLAPDGAEFSRAEAEHQSLASELVTGHVIPALLWRLASHAGREAAMRYASAVAERQTRVAIGDAARLRVSARLVAEPTISGWRRVTGPTTCARCARQAGVLSPDRAPLVCHPACRCSAEPVLRGVTETVSRATPTVVAP